MNRKIQCQHPGCNVCSIETVDKEWAEGIEQDASNIEDGCIWGQSGDDLKGFCKVENTDIQSFQPSEG